MRFSLIDFSYSQCMFNFCVACFSECIPIRLVCVELIVSRTKSLSSCRFYQLQFDYFMSETDYLLCLAAYCTFKYGNQSSRKAKSKCMHIYLSLYMYIRVYIYSF